MVQFSATGGCSQSFGPAFSLWHLVQFSLTEFSISKAGLGEPCGLWQSTQAIFPSIKGIWEDFWNCIFFILWHVKQTSGAVSLASWFSSETFFITVWQETQASPRDSWMEPVQWVCTPFSWHWRQTWFQSSSFSPSSALKVQSRFRSSVFSTCPPPGPWQASHIFFSNSVWAFCSTPKCTVC